MKGEINLLPQEIALRRERRAFLIGVGRLLQRIMLMLAVLIVGELAVYASFVYVDKELEKADEAQQGGYSVMSEVIQVNAVLTQAEQIKSKYISWSLFVEEILSNAPPGIKINKMQVVEGEGVLRVEGFADSRGTVLDFQNLLKELSWVIRVEAPLQNYALGIDTGFSFDLVVTEEKK